MAGINDKLRKASDGTQVANVAAVISARSAGETVLQCDDLAGWAEDTAVDFTTYTPDPDSPNGDILSGTQQLFKGIVNKANNSITNVTMTHSGYNDGGNLIGDIVKAIQTDTLQNDLVDALEPVIDQANGGLKDGAVTADTIANGAVGTDALANEAVTSEKIADGGVESHNIAFATFTTITDANGWDVTTIPGIKVYYKHFGGVNIYGTQSAGNFKFPEGETWSSVASHMILQARTGSVLSGGANDVNAVARQYPSDPEIFQMLVTTGGATNGEAYISGLIIKPTS